MLSITLDWRDVLMSEYWELKEKGIVDERVVKALLNYTVSKDD